MNRKALGKNEGVRYYALPLIGALLAGYVVGDFLPIGGVAGALIGAFIVDAFNDLRVLRLLANELKSLKGWKGEQENTSEAAIGEESGD